MHFAWDNLARLGWGYGTMLEPFWVIIPDRYVPRLRTATVQDPQAFFGSQDRETNNLSRPELSKEKNLETFSITESHLVQLTQ